MKKLSWIEERCAITDALNLCPECSIEAILKRIEILKQVKK